MSFAGVSLQMHAGPAPEALAQRPMLVQRSVSTVCSRVRRSRRASNSRRSLRVHAEASEDNTIVPAELSLAPVKPKSAVGEMLAYYYQAQPHLFKEVIERQFAVLAEERDAKEAAEREQREQAAEASEGAATSSMDLTLYRRMDEVREMEKRATVEDLMYAAVLEKFLSLGVNMLGNMDNILEKTDTLSALTEGVHSREALDMVKDHVKNVMGPAAAAYGQTMLKMSKLQAAQVYAASIMFGYFVRRVDKRFQLERGLGLLDQGDSDAVSRLERLFAQAEDIDVTDNPDVISPSSPSDDASSSSTGVSALDPEDQPPQQPSPPAAQDEDAAAKKGDSAGVLRRYIESFDQQTMIDTARLVSAEGAALVETQTNALFGDVKALTRQMQEAVGNVNSLEEVMKKVQEAVEQDKVENMTITVGTQRRAVLEAIAFGAFLRDVETHVDMEYRLLTPVSSAGGGPFSGRGDGDGSGGSGGGGGNQPVRR